MGLLAHSRQMLALQSENTSFTDPLKISDQIAACREDAAIGYAGGFSPALAVSSAT
jgi:hypothetical protein